MDVIRPNKTETKQIFIIFEMFRKQQQTKNTKNKTHFTYHLSTFSVLLHSFLTIVCQFYVVSWLHSTLLTFFFFYLKTHKKKQRRKEKSTSTYLNTNNFFLWLVKGGNLRKKKKPMQCEMWHHQSKLKTHERLPHLFFVIFFCTHKWNTFHQRIHLWSALGVKGKRNSYLVNYFFIF